MKNILLIFLLSWCCACQNAAKKEPKNTATSIHATLNDSIKTVDLAILNGMVIDGTGAPAYPANVYIKADKIVFIGTLTHPELTIKKSLDASGSIVSPGFIDLHAHGNPLRTPDFENFLAMGVTTISLGQDGSSPHQRDLGAYIAQVNSQRLGVNVVQFVGHGTLRSLAGIGTEENLSEAQMDALRNLLKEQLVYCFGLSTGLEYNPGRYAKQEELLELAKIVGAAGKVIASHMRNEDDDALMASITELAQQGTYANVHISHLKSVYGKGAQRALKILDTIKKFRAQGIKLTADSYPYLASYTGIAIVFPPWAKTLDQFAVAKKTRRAELATFLRNKVNQRNGPAATLFGTPPYTGKTLEEVALEKNAPFEDVLIDDIGPQGASAAYFVMDKGLQETLLADPWVSLASDGSKTGTHPRGHGTFAKFIEDYVVHSKTLNLEEAIRKMTSFPAAILGLSDRGILKAGNLADLIIFKPEKVKALATFSEPFQLAEGFNTVIVGGIISRHNGELSRQRNGKIIIPHEKK